MIFRFWDRAPHRWHCVACGTDVLPNNMGMVVLGTFILWFWWYGFNCDTCTAAAMSSGTTVGLPCLDYPDE